MAIRTGAVAARPAAIALPPLPSVAAAIADAQRNSRRVAFIRMISTLSRWGMRVKAKTGLCQGFVLIEISGQGTESKQEAQVRFAKVKQLLSSGDKDVGGSGRGVEGQDGHGQRSNHK